LKVLRLLLKHWCQLWQSNASSSNEIDARKWAEKIDSINRDLYKRH